MFIGRIVPVAAAVVFFCSGSFVQSEERTKVLENSRIWHMNPFQHEGYTVPDGLRSLEGTPYLDVVTMKDELEIACDRIDEAFARNGYKMQRDYRYDRDGVVFRATGYDKLKKVGYIWATPERIGDDFYLRTDEASTEEQKIFLSVAEVKLLENRAPHTQEFIAVIVPYNYYLGYSRQLYRDVQEKRSIEKRFAEKADARFAALHKRVVDYVNWVEALRAEEYPAPSPKPRNLLTFTHWQKQTEPEYPFGICGVGLPTPISQESALESLQIVGREAGFDFSASYTYKAGGAVVTFTGYDSKQKIGFVWEDAPKEKERLAQIEMLAKRAAEEDLHIAWISPSDLRFNHNESDESLWISDPPYSDKLATIHKISDSAVRALALKELYAEIARDNELIPRKRLERRMREFMDWANTP